MVPSKTTSVFALYTSNTWTSRNGSCGATYYSTVCNGRRSDTTQVCSSRSLAEYTATRGRSVQHEESGQDPWKDLEKTRVHCSNEKDQVQQSATAFFVKNRWQKGGIKDQQLQNRTMTEETNDSRGTLRTEEDRHKQDFSVCSLLQLYDFKSSKILRQTIKPTAHSTPRAADVQN